MESWVLSLLLVSAYLVHVQGKAFVRFCYFPNWAHYRESPYTRFDVEHIDPSLCTHLVYAFAAIDVDSFRIIPRYRDEDPGDGQTRGRYQKFNDIKKANRHIRTLVSIGGELAGSDPFIAITKDDKSLQTFARTTVDFLRKRGFDGLDIDWEYPNATTKAQFSSLLKTLRTTFEVEAERTRGERLLLTAALPAGRHRIQDGFDIDVLNRSLDLAGLMTYDYHGRWNSVTGFDSPLFSRKSDRQFNQELSTAWTVNYYISQGLAASKVLVGVTAAGTHFKLRDVNVTGVGAPVIQSDQPRLSDLWQLPDRSSYPEICRVVRAADSERVFDEDQQVPYVYQDQDWFGYEDVQSITGKTDWMLKKGVAGVLFWALDMDDFTGMLCEQGTFPLLRALSKTVEKVEGPTREGYSGTGGRNGSSWVLSLALIALGLFW